MQSSIPSWLWPVLAYLAFEAVRLRVPDPPAPEVLARLEALRIEHDPARMCARELRQLPGVGETLAQAIVDAREQRGRSPLAWEDVPGIGEVRARGIRAWCRARGFEPDPWTVSESYPLAMTLLRRVSLAVLAFFTGCGGVAETAAGAASEPAPAPAAAPETPRALALQGGALHALETGPDGGRVVLLLHGARFSAQTWSELGTLGVLARAGYHAVALDWPGHGATPAWDAVDGDELLRAVCAELGGRGIALVAPSMGGRSAVEFLQHSPGASAVAGLVAVAPALADFEAPRGWKFPTLLVWGERDETVPLERGRELAKRWDARLEVLSGASHPCYLDQPERFHALLLAFLAGLGDAPR